MQNVFIILNQDGYFLGKSGDWLDGREPAQLFRTLYKDEAVNQLFEISSKEAELRLSIMQCPVKNRLVPDIPEAQLPAPLVKTVADNDDAIKETTQAQVDIASL